MTLRRALNAVAFCAALVFPVGAFAEASSETPRAVLLFTGEQSGYLLPCGCTKGMMGGIDRRATAIKQIRAEKRPVLLVDNGGLIGGVSTQDRIKRDILLQAMQTMGYDVMGVGKSDLIAGLSSFLPPIEDSGIQVVSSNIFYLDGRRLFSPGKIFTLDKLRVGVTAAFDPELIEPTEPIRRELRFADPAQALKGVLDEWRGKVDLTVLLYHGPHAKAMDLARELGEFDLIVSGYDNDLMVKEVGRVGRTPVVITGVKAKYLGRIDVLKGEKAVFGPVQPIALSEDVPKEQDMRDLMDFYRSMLKSEWGNLVTKRKKGLPDDEMYVSSHLCGTCHKAAWEKLKQEDKHFHALETLEKDGSAWDPECVVCHVVGLEYKSGYVNKTLTRTMGHVGCDSCHGPGSAHMVKSVAENAPKANGEKSCLQCHTLEHDPKFDYKTYWPKVEHPTPPLEKEELKKQ